MKKFLSIIFILLVIACTATSPYKRQARIYETQRDFENMVKLCNEWMQKEPMNIEPFFYLGRAYTMGSKFIEGAKAFEKGLQKAGAESKIYIEEFPEMSIAFQNAGILYKQKDSLLMAIHFFEKAYSLDTTNIEVLLSLAGIYALKGGEEMLKKSKEILEKALSIGQDNPDVVYHYALFIKDDSPDSALALFEKLIKIESGKPRGYARAGEIYLIKEDYKKAKEYLKKAYEMDTTDLNTYFNYGYALLLDEECKSALVVFNEILKKSEDKEDPSLYKLTGSTYECLSDFPKALEFYDKALKLVSDDISVLKAKAYVLSELGRKKEAYEILKKVEKLEKK